MTHLARGVCGCGGVGVGVCVSGLLLVDPVHLLHLLHVDLLQHLAVQAVGLSEQRNTSVSYSVSPKCQSARGHSNKTKQDFGLTGFPIPKASLG